MNKIYLDKLCDFAFTTYKNYEAVNKNFSIDDFINNIKQNQSLNERGIFLKHNFVELKTIVPEIEYEQMVLINPICFNLSGNIEWYNFLNAILTVLNDNYLHEANLIKKTILETADKTFRKKITISNEIDDKIINNVCILTNITLIILNEENTTQNNLNDKQIKNKRRIRIFKNDNKINKVVVMVNREKEYYSVLNWNKKYYQIDSEFIKYIVDKNKIFQLNETKSNDSDDDDFIRVVNKKKKKGIISDDDCCVKKEIKKNKTTKLNNNNMFDFNDNDNENDDENGNEKENEKENENKNENPIDKTDKNTISNETNTDMYDGKNNILTKEPNKGTYKELVADENYAIYISEVVDNNVKNKKENILSDKKKKKNDKNDKNIFVINKSDQSVSGDLKNTINENNENNENNGNGENNENNEETSIFNKTEHISKKDVEKISGEIKLSMGLETIQTYALKLGISIFEGSTKTGKPKNKTKSELIEQIKEFAKKYSN
jgi:hypothetical protein